MSYEEYAKFQTIYDDGEVSDESFDPKYIDEVMKNQWFLDNLYKSGPNGELNCCIRDSARNEYALVDGKCVMTYKFIKETYKYEKCEPLE
jgi:hypothetical protein